MYALLIKNGTAKNKTALKLLYSPSTKCGVWMRSLHKPLWKSINSCVSRELTVLVWNVNTGGCFESCVLTQASCWGLGLGCFLLSLCCRLQTPEKEGCWGEKRDSTHYFGAASTGPGPRRTNVSYIYWLPHVITCHPWSHGNTPTHWGYQLHISGK